MLLGLIRSSRVAYQALVDEELKLHVVADKNMSLAQTMASAGRVIFKIGVCRNPVSRRVMYHSPSSKRYKSKRVVISGLAQNVCAAHLFVFRIEACFDE